MSLAHYSPEDVRVLFGGFINISGFHEDTFVTISKDSEVFSTFESADGVVSRQHNPSTLYTVTLVLAGTSESNQILTIASNLDNATKMAMVPFIIKDTLGSTLLFSPKSWIEEYPDVVFGTRIEGRSWKIKCANATLMVGGNEKASSVAGDLLGVAGGMLGGLL